MCGILRKFDGIGEDAQLPRHKYQVGTSDIEAWQKLTPEAAENATENPGFFLFATGTFSNFIQAAVFALREVSGVTGTLEWRDCAARAHCSATESSPGKCAGRCPLCCRMVRRKAAGYEQTIRSGSGA